jgi:hypothetical protein
MKTLKDEQNFYKFKTGSILYVYNLNAHAIVYKQMSRYFILYSSAHPICSKVALNILKRGFSPWSSVFLTIKLHEIINNYINNLALYESMQE